jgi:hypothetical protein
LQGQRLCGGKPANVFQQAGDAEVEELRLAIRGDQDIGGLDIAMDDHPIMRVTYRCTYLEEQGHPLTQREIEAIAPLVDALTLHVFHGEEGAAIASAAAVDQLDDARMVQPGEDAALLGEALERNRRNRLPHVDELQRDTLCSLRVRTIIDEAIGEVHHAHAALAEQMPNPVPTIAQANHARSAHVVRIPEQGRHERHIAGVFGGVQYPLHFFR